jgi:hypothetical protein
MNFSSKPSVSLHLARLLGVALLALPAVSQAGNVTCDNNGTSCTAPTTVTTPGSASSRNTTQAFAGVNWTFGVGPDLVVGVRQTRTNSRQHVSGVRLEAVFPFSTAFSKISFDRLRLRYVGGNRSAMYELGGGYSFSGQGFLGSAALQGQHISLGTDLIFGGMQWLPYVGFDTMAKPKRATSVAGTSSTTCPDGFTLTDAASLSISPTFINVSPSDQLNGQTCYKPSTLTPA